MKILFYLLNTFSIIAALVVIIYMIYLYKQLRKSKYLLFSLLSALLLIISINNSIPYMIFVSEDSLILLIILNAMFIASAFLIYIGPKTLESLRPIQKRKKIFLWLIASILSFILIIISHIINHKFIFLILPLQAISIIRNGIISIIIKRKQNPEKSSFTWAVLWSFTISAIILPFRLVIDIPSPLKEMISVNIPEWLKISPIQNILCLLPMLLFIFRDIMSHIDENADQFEIWCKRIKLSKREKELIPHLIEGKTYKEIGELLFIAPSTVKTHIQNIYKKSKLKNRFELLKALQ